MSKTPTNDPLWPAFVEWYKKEHSVSPEAGVWSVWKDRLWRCFLAGHAAKLKDDSKNIGLVTSEEYKATGQPDTTTGRDGDW